MGQETPSDSKLPANEKPHAPAGGTRSPVPKSAQVVIRFVARMLILGVFAALGSQAFPRTLESLLAMAALYCVIVASIRCEAPFGPVLTHFDEAAAYALCARVASWAS